ncbi:MAG: NUDIX hydrolase [Candidatus Enteromonas sp.]
MRWTYLSADQDTHHRFLNLYTLHYEVTKDDGTKAPYEYYVASRNTLDTLMAKKPDFSRPDGVIMALYFKDPETQEISILINTQFRPALGAYMTSFPAGLLDPEDEDEQVAAIREAKEESGVLITDLERLVPPSPTSSGLSDEIDSLILARIESLGDARLEDFEDISSRLVPLKDIPTMLRDTDRYVIPLPARLTLLYLLERFR